MHTATSHKIAWRHDFEGALDDAKRERKLVLLEVKSELRRLAERLKEKQPTLPG